MNKTENPIAVQSKQWIMESLVSLMEKKTFQEITVSEISENAQLVRRTFYRNFDSKEDVLQAYFRTLIEEFTGELSKLPVLTTNTALRTLFVLCKKYEGFFMSLKRSRMLGVLLNLWNEVLPKLHTLMLGQIRDFPRTSSDRALEYLLAFNVGGTYNMLIKWINEGMVLSADELAAIVSEFSSGSLRA